tara:strand:+ start:567 stop:749 length:183 start_codon:yes stop_codon:yes gene_type:complete
MSSNKRNEEVGRLEGQLKGADLPEGMKMNYRLVVSRNAIKEQQGEKIADHIIKKIEEAES